MFDMHDIAQLTDNYLAFELCYMSKKSHRAYQMQKPTYFMGLFEGYYQIAYMTLDSETLQDAIDFANDEMVYMNNRFGASLTSNKFHYGYYCAMMRFVRFMSSIRDRYYSENDYTLRHVMSCVYVDDMLEYLNTL